MQVTTARSAAATARRSQIVEATIDALAEVGSAGASFAVIARRAGISSTRLISYHFADRAELMAEVVARVVGELATAVGTEVRAATSPRDALHRYIEANVGWMDTHRPRIRALTALLLSGTLQLPDGAGSSGADALTSIITAGQREGQFGDVDAGVAATVVARTVEDVAVQLLRADPNADLTGHAAKLVAFFDAALASRPVDAVTR